MKLLRNDDVIIVDQVVYQFHALHDSKRHCAGCAFDAAHLVSFVCPHLHCVGERRIDQLTGHFKKI